MKKKKFDMSVILKIYYVLLASFIKLDKKSLKRIKLKRGAKQGGVISGILFNFFLDDLLTLCSESGFGATFFEIIQCIFGLCDDICLLSQIIYNFYLYVNHMQINGLLNLICQSAKL
jgi:retron-type reverse transcriptase